VLEPESERIKKEDKFAFHHSCVLGRQLREMNLLSFKAAVHPPRQNQDDGNNSSQCDQYFYEFSYHS